MPRPRTRSPRKRLPGPEVCAHDPDQSRPNTVMKGPPARRIDPSGVPFRKFEEEVLRTLRGLRPHPLPHALDPALPGCCAKRTRGALRRDWTTRPPTQSSVAERGRISRRRGAEGLAECEGLPPRTSGTGHQMDQFSGQGAFHHCVGVRLIRVMRANLRARKPFARRSCPRARHGGGTSDWWSAGGYPRRDEWQFRGAAGPDVPPCCGGLRKEQNPRLDHDPATRRLPAPEGSGSRRMAELGTANRFPAP